VDKKVKGVGDWLDSALTGDDGETEEEAQRRFEEEQKKKKKKKKEPVWKKNLREKRENERRLAGLAAVIEDVIEDVKELTWEA